MKKFYLFLLTLMVGVASAFAQIAEGNYYIQNVESGLFLSGNNSWGTQASATVAGDEVNVAAVDGGYTLIGTTLASASKTLGYNLFVDTNVSQNGNVWTIAPVEGEDGVYTIYGKGKKDNVEDAFDGYIAQSATPGVAVGYVLEGATEVTDAAKWRFLTADEFYKSIKAGTNVTSLLFNPGFTRNHATSYWTVNEGCTNKNLSGGADNNKCAESYHSIFNIHQTINVPNGTYSVTAQGFYRQDGADNENLPVFYANGEEKLFPLKTGTENSMSDASNSFTQGLYTIEPIIVEVTDGKLTVGVKNDVNGNLWCIWDNFQVTCVELAQAEAPEVAIEEGEGTYTITSTSADAALYYLCKPTSWLDEGETPESCLQNDIEGMGIMIDSKETWELYDHMGLEPAPKTFTVADYEELYAGQDMFIVAANVGWDGEKLAVISNVVLQDFTVGSGNESQAELVNADFSEGVVGDVNIATYAKDGDIHQMQPVPGWEFGVENGDARAAGVVAYGSKTTLGGSGYTVPAAGPEGTNGNALAVVGVWTGVVQYVQNVTLPAGKYKLTVPVYNTQGTNDFVKNLIGVKYGETEVYASTKKYPVGAWTDEVVEFELNEETAVTVSLGYEGANVGSGASQHLFLDCVKIEAESNAPEVAIEEGEGTYTITSTSADAALYYLCKPYTWLEERETPESVLMEQIEMMASAVESEEDWEMYGHMGLEPAPKTFTVADYEEMYAGQDMFIVAANVGWDGEKIAVLSNVVLKDFTVPGTVVPLEAEIAVNGTELTVTYAPGTGLGDNYTVKPYILSGEDKIEVADYAIDNTTGDFFDPLNLIVISLNEELADGDYTLVLPADMFIVNGGNNNPEWTYNFTASAGEPEIEVVLIADEETEYTLNTHSFVTIDAPVSAIKVYGLDQIMEDVHYAIYDKRNTLAEGILSVNTIGYAEFAPVALYEGIQYNVVLTAGDSANVIYDTYVIGAMEEPSSEIALAKEMFKQWDGTGADANVVADVNDCVLNLGNSTDCVYGWSNLDDLRYADLSAYEELVITYTDGFPRIMMNRVDGAFITISEQASTEYYTVNENADGSKTAIVDLKKFVEDKGYAHLNSIKASAYNTQVTVTKMTLTEPEEPIELAVSLLAEDGETEYALNTHSFVTIDAPVAAIKVAGLDQIMEEVHYAIYDKRETMAEGILSVNTIGYAEFAPISLYEGIMYNVVLTVGDSADVIYDNYVIGAMEEPASIEGNLFEISWNGMEIPADAKFTCEFEKSYHAVTPSISSFDPATDQKVIIKLAEPLDVQYNTPYKDASGTQQWHATSTDAPGYDIIEIDVTDVMTDFNIQHINPDAGHKFTIVESYILKNDESQVPLTWSAGWGSSVTVSGVTHGLATISAQWAGINMAAPEAFLQDGTKTLRVYTNNVMSEDEFQWCMKDIDGKDLWPALGVDETGTYAEFTTDLKIQSLFIQHKTTEASSLDIVAVTWEYTEPIELAVLPSLVLGEEEVSLNAHSNVSVESANALKVEFENGANVIGVTYLINKMDQKEDEEGIFWTVGAELASGEMSLNTIAYAELDSLLFFEQGQKYQLTVVPFENPTEPTEMGQYTFEFNGSYVAPIEIAVSLLADSAEYALNTHSYVTIDAPVSAIKVTGLDQIMETVHYAIYDKRETMAEGILSVNTIGYAEFDAISLYEGIMYNIVLTVGDSAEVIYDNYVIGAMEEPQVSELMAYMLEGGLFTISSNDMNMNFNNQDVAWTAEPSNFQFALEAPQAIEGEDYTGKYVLRIYENGQPRDFWGQQAHYVNFQPEGGSIIFGLWNNNQNGTDVKNGAVFTIEETEDGFLFKNVARGLYLSANGMSADPAACVVAKYDPTATGINSIDMAAKNGKFMQNGKIVIVKNGKTYNVAGQLIK